MARLKDEFVTVEHYLLALAASNAPARDCLRSSTSRTSGSCRRSWPCARHRVTDPEPEAKYQALEKYGRDLTELARAARSTR